MKTNHDEILRKILEDIDEHGYLNHRESNTYEFKETFNMGNKSLYARTLACFANNKGGYILFGVKDKPRNLIGVDKIKFDSIKQEDITTFLKDHYEPEIKWDSGTVISQEKYFGYIYAHEAEEKPVICTSNTKESSQGDIFYRYRGQNKKIGYTELKKMIYDILNKERTAMMRHIEKIARTGPQKIAMIDLLTGKIETDKIEGTKLIMDKKLLDDLKEKVKFIEAGHFTDTGGAPTLKLIGEIMPVSKIIIPELDPNKGYPYIQGQLADKLGIKPYHVRVLVWKYKLKGDSQFHTAIVTSRSGSVHKFSEKAFDSLSDILREHNDDLNSFIDNISKEYNKREKHS